MKNIFGTRPIIVIGMHRSGTTLLTKLMEKGGVSWGWQKDEYNESIFFQDINERLFSMANGTWDHPEPVKAFMADHRHLGQAEKSIRQLLSQTFPNGWFGKIDHADSVETPKSFPLWGWKDPRNTYTLPVWRRIFPGACVIHIIRNGIDVSKSLCDRETSRPEGALHPHFSMLCQTLNGCFTLWKQYVQAGRKQSNGNDNTIEIRFEDLLAKPGFFLNRIFNFIGVKPEAEMDRVITMVNPQRRLAYQKNSSLNGFYRKVKDDPLMIELGYSH